MDRVLVKRILALQDDAMRDERYLGLLNEYRIFDKRLLKALEEMAPGHRDVVMDYLGAVHTINERMVELALTLDEKC